MMEVLLLCPPLVLNFFLFTSSLSLCPLNSLATELARTSDSFSTIVAVVYLTKPVPSVAVKK